MLDTLIPEWSFQDQERPDNTCREWVHACFANIWCIGSVQLLFVCLFWLILRYHVCLLLFGCVLCLLLCCCHLCDLHLHSLVWVAELSFVPCCLAWHFHVADWRCEDILIFMFQYCLSVVKCVMCWIGSWLLPFISSRLQMRNLTMAIALFQCFSQKHVFWSAYVLHMIISKQLMACFVVFAPAAVSCCHHYQPWTYIQWWMK